MVVTAPYQDKSEDEASAVSNQVTPQLVRFLQPLLAELDRRLDA